MNATATAASWPMACGKNTSYGVPTTASTVMTESRRKATLSQIGRRESAPTISRMKRPRFSAAPMRGAALC